MCTHTCAHTHSQGCTIRLIHKFKSKLIFVESYGLCSRLRHILASTIRVRKGLRQGPLSALAALYYFSSKWTVGPRRM